MKNAHPVLATLIVWLILPAFSYAIEDSEQSFRFRHFDAADGLTSRSVASICVDKDGCIWTGTSHGVFRYSGDRFSLIDVPENMGFDLSNINYMIVDKKNRLWIITSSDVYVYDIETQIYTKVDIVTTTGKRLSLNTSRVAEDNDGNIWISTYNVGVLKYDIKTSEIKQYTFEGTNNFVYKVYIDNDNIVWASLGDSEHILARLNKLTDKFEYLPVRYDNPERKDQILTIFEDSKQNFWIGTWNNGIQKLDKYSGHIKTYITDPQIPFTHIHSISEYQPDKLFIGSDDGLFLYDILTHTYTLFTPDNSNPFSISDKFVYPVTRDHEGGFWIGTYYGGINYISPFDSFFYGNSCSEFTNSKTGSIVSCICEGNNGDIWLGTDDKGLIRFRPSDGSYEHFMPDTEKNSLSFHNVHALCFDNEKLWIGTYTGGLNIYNTISGEFEDNNLNISSIYSIFKDFDNNMWVGTMESIQIYDRERESLETVKSIGGIILDICQDTSGLMWFATQTSGLQQFNPKNGEWKEYYPQRSPKASQVRCINSVYVDEYNTIWAGTPKGLFRYDVKTDSLEYVHTHSGQIYVCSIASDNQILWISTTNGILRFDTESGNCIEYNQIDGLQSDQFLPASGMKTKDGNIYFGSINGFNSFSPYKIKINNSFPNVMLTQLYVNNILEETGDNNILKKSLNSLDEISLLYNQNNISFNYSALSYYSPHKINYAYRLEGFDDDWNHVKSKKTATYTNLSPGTYEFQVKTSNSYGTWDENYKSILITILPPFWRSSLFMVLYIVLAIFLLIWTVFFIIRRTERKHRQKIELLNQQKEKEMYDEKMRFFTSIAHEIRTPLSLIIGPIERILTSDNDINKDIENDLNTVDRNSQRLLSLVNQLLDLRKIEQNARLNFFFLSRNMPMLIKSVIETYMPYLVQYEVELDASRLENFEAEVNPEAIAKIISNLLTNAAKYSRGKVILECLANKQEQNFNIIVKDNGKGIPEDEINNLFKPFYCIADENNGTGIGLSIVKSLVNAHNGSVEIESVVDQGTSFIITLPLKQKTEEESISNDYILSETVSQETDNDQFTVLLVEDKKEMMDFLYDNLSHDYNILTAKNGADALELLESNNVSIIVCDWMMPVMDGIELCKNIRSNIYISHIPFLMLTAKTDLNSKIEGMETGVDIFIEKPFSINYLCACIKNLLDMRKSMMEKFSNTPLIPLSGIAPNSCNKEFLSQVNDIIEKNISNQELSIDLIVKHLCVSRSGFFAKIKMLTDVTPNDLIRIVRLKKAAELMLQERYYVNEICYMVGFRNPSYFSKCFHKQFGVTPVEFIKSHSSSTLTDYPSVDRTPENTGLSGASKTKFP